MSEHRCFMGPLADEGERYYVMVMQELTIYGHSVDAWTREKYPEDWPLTLDARTRGFEFGCYHSNACADGELGTNPMSSLREITREQFIEAWDAGWPDLMDSPITQEGPVAAVGFIDADGNAVKVWDSLHGDYDSAA
jgi:hypothetical protein